MYFKDTLESVKTLVVNGIYYLPFVYHLRNLLSTLHYIHPRESCMFYITDLKELSLLQKFLITFRQW